MSEAGSSPQISQRELDRDGRTISALVWEISRAPSEADAEILRSSRSMNGNWLLLPSTHSGELLAQWRPHLVDSDKLIVGVDSDDLVARRSAALQDRLAPLGRARCEAVLLQDAETDSLKAGRPFHRLSQLRDTGLTQFMFLDAPTAEVAEWMVENTPARAVAVPFDLSDQTARYRLFRVAHEMETKLLSRRATAQKIQVDATLVEDISVRLSEPQVTALIEPLPNTAEQLAQSVNALSVNLPAEQREKWWKQFQEQVPPPAKPKRGHPPEYGS